MHLPSPLHLSLQLFPQIRASVFKVIFTIFVCDPDSPAICYNCSSDIGNPHLSRPYFSGHE